jgi:hypothetical protein
MPAQAEDKLSRGVNAEHRSGPFPELAAVRQISRLGHGRVREQVREAPLVVAAHRHLQ